MASPYRLPAARKPDPASTVDRTGVLGAAVVALFFALLMALARQHGLSL